MNIKFLLLSLFLINFSHSGQAAIDFNRFVQDIPLRPSHPSYQTLLDTENGLAQFTGHPVLLTWGERDWCFTTEFLDEFERRFPSARTLRFADAGHLLFEEVPDQVLAGIRKFLADFPLDG